MINKVRRHLEEKHALTTMELADDMRCMKKPGILDENDNCRNYGRGQWKFEPASVDHHLQQRLIEFGDEDLTFSYLIEQSPAASFPDG